MVSYPTQPCFLSLLDILVQVVDGPEIRINGMAASLVEASRVEVPSHDSLLGP